MSTCPRFVPIVDFTPTDNLLLRATVHAGWNRRWRRVSFSIAGQGVDFRGQSGISRPQGGPWMRSATADEDNDIYARAGLRRRG